MGGVSAALGGVSAAVGGVSAAVGGVSAAVGGVSAAGARAGVGGRRTGVLGGGLPLFRSAGQLSPHPVLLLLGRGGRAAPPGDPQSRAPVGGGAGGGAGGVFGLFAERVLVRGALAAVHGAPGLLLVQLLLQP